MSTPEVYTIVLRSDDGLGSSTSELSYFINWETVLPKEKTKFVAKGIFHGFHDTEIYSLKIQVSSLHPVIWDSATSGKSNFLCYAHGLFSSALTGGELVYGSSASDTEGILVDRPTQNNTTVTLTDVLGIGADVSTWSLIIQLSPVD